MVYNRLPTRDPRTVSREIPGVLNAIFPQLAPGVVAFLNRRALRFNEQNAVTDDLIQQSSLQHAMLFEIAVARGEQLIEGAETNWEHCLELATSRQRRHFDAKIPDSVQDIDLEIADLVANNLFNILNYLRRNNGRTHQNDVIIGPEIPGYQWISSGNGDFAYLDSIVEVKCSERNFGAADYRQILMYWLLSYAYSLEKGGNEWKKAVLLNPRSNVYLEMRFDYLIEITAAGKSKVEILELFASIVDDFGWKI